MKAIILINKLKGGFYMSTVIGVFDEQGNAEQALKQIKDAGISEDKISMVARDEENNDTGYMNQNLTNGTATGGALGGLAGLAASVGALAIPGIGPILAVGPIAAGLSGAAAGGIAGGLVDMGIPEERGNYYENEVKSGKILAAVETEEDKVNDIASHFRNNGASDVETH